MSSIKKPAKNAADFVEKAHRAILKTYYETFTFLERKKLVRTFKLRRGITAQYYPSSLENALAKTLERQFKSALEEASKYWGQLEIDAARKALGLEDGQCFTNKQFIDYFIKQRGDEAYEEARPAQ